MNGRAWTMGALLGAVAAASGACLGSEGRALDCGAGDAWAFAGADYCIYASAIIIEGFDCPAALPFAFEVDGAIVCSPTETAPEGTSWQQIVEAWEQANGGPMSACEGALGRAVGAAVEVVDVGACTVEARCAEGVVARCANGLYACDCTSGDMRCIAVPSAACPAHAAAEGEACLVELAADACADGLYCAEDARCHALPSLCESGCYRDADCAGGACAGGSAVTATVGRCVAANAPGTCWQDGDCPTGWTCANAFVSCAACAPCPSPLDYVGQCQPPDGSAGLGLVVDAAGDVQAVWWLAVGYGLVPCPSFTLELREERTGVWEAGPGESGCSAAEAPPFAQPLVRATPPLGAADFAWRWVRARGSYYQGCLGATPDTCSEGPIAIESEPLLVLDQAPQ